MVIGPTLDESSRIILTDKNLHFLDEFKMRFLQLYDDKLVLETPQYPHVDKTLKQLHDQGDHLTIVTNKRAYPTYKLIYHYGWHQFFKWIACMDQYPAATKKSEMIKQKKIKYQDFSSVFLIGDTLSDAEAASANNINFIQANYGYGKKEDWHSVKIFRTIKKFDEILNL